MTPGDAATSVLPQSQPAAPVALEIPIPGWTRLIVGVGGLAVVLSALAVVGVALAKSTVPSWALLGFEGVLAATGVFALLASRRGAWRSPAMALACLAGTIALASVFAYFGARGMIEVAGRDGGISLKPWIGGRGLVALALSASAVYLGLRGSREGVLLFRKGVIAGVPLVALVAGWWFSASMLASFPGWARGVVITFAALGVAILLCMSTNWLIRAFETARRDQLNA